MLLGSSGVVGGRAAGAPSSPSPPRRKEDTVSWVLRQKNHSTTYNYILVTTFVVIETCLSGFTSGHDMMGSEKC